MPVDFPSFNDELKALANKYQVHIVGKATPVATDEDPFDITATATEFPPAEPSTTPPVATV